MTSYGEKIWVNIGPSNGLSPDGTKLLSKPMLINEVLWPSSEDNLTASAKNTILYNYTFRITATSPS